MGAEGQYYLSGNSGPDDVSIHAGEPAGDTVLKQLLIRLVAPVYYKSLLLPSMLSRTLPQLL